MGNPILFVVADDGETLAPLAEALRRRFGADYQVLTDQSPISTLARLEQVWNRGEEISRPARSDRRVSARVAPVRLGPRPQLRVILYCVVPQTRGDLFALPGGEVGREKQTDQGGSQELAPPTGFVLFPDDYQHMHGQEPALPGAIKRGAS